MKYPVLTFKQPAGDFLLSVMPAASLIRIAKALPRKFDSTKLESTDGIQREPSSARIRKIAAYATSVDAAFPTPILLALTAGSYKLENGHIEIEDAAVAELVDGQHRIRGLIESGRASEFDLPVVFILEPTEEQKALIFATINGTQTKVPASLIYDLFGVTEGRSPQKSAHEIARALNATVNSPWYRRLKMLGKKTPGSAESLSQGTFVKCLLPLISTDPMGDMNKAKLGEQPPAHEESIFNEYFRKDQDSATLKVLLNAFSAERKAWPAEWDAPDQFVLTKTTGFIGTMKALPVIVARGKQSGDLSEDFFDKVFTKAARKLVEQGKRLTSDHFPPGSRGETDFRNLLTESLE